MKKYIGIIDRCEVHSTYQFGDPEEMQRLEFKSPSLQAAKAKMTRAANLQEFGTDWDGNPKHGKDERWRGWVEHPDFKQKDGTMVSCDCRVSDTELWHFDAAQKLIKYKLRIWLYYKSEA